MGTATALILMLRGYSAQDPIEVRYLNLSDAFTVPAVIMIMVGILVWISSMGGFDMLGYAFKRAKEAFIPSPSYHHEQFYDYKVRQDEKRAKSFGYMFISGGIYFIPGIVFNILHALA